MDSYKGIRKGDSVVFKDRQSGEVSTKRVIGFDEEGLILEDLPEIPSMEHPPDSTREEVIKYCQENPKALRELLESYITDSVITASEYSDDTWETDGRGLGLLLQRLKEND